MRAQLLEAEAAHFAKKKASFNGNEELEAVNVVPAKRQLEADPGQDGEVGQDIEAKRRRVLEETRDIDADSDGSSNTSSEEDR